MKKKGYISFTTRWWHGWRRPKWVI